MDYPDETPRMPLYDIGGERQSECDRMREAAAFLPNGEPAPRRRAPRIFFSGVVQTKSQCAARAAHPAPSRLTLSPPSPSPSPSPSP